MIKKGSVKNLLVETIQTILGSVIMAVGVSLFLIPCKLSTGGFAGIATIIYYFCNIPAGITILLLNIPIYLFAAYKLGKKFLAKAILGTTVYSLAIDFLEKYQLIEQDKFLSCIYGGVIVGLGTAIILKANSSTGGTELISNIVLEYNPRLKISNLMMIIDVIIVVANMICFGEIEIGLYSAIAIYLYGKMIDIIFEGIYFTKLLIIISDESDKIAKEIESKIKRGTTGLYGKGMYTNTDKLVLICAASRGDIGRIKQLVKEIDKNSFIIITNSREVLGKGFKR